ncbi:MAG TPA: succinate dehydrogenase, cytochrome b556 subunit [Stellaceae bacterium]|nr:succinate dehydrogenase, cytochrome b556 subunit [Stellaceae bacterium]
MTPAERPLSPHLQIYKPQLTSVLSITHRGTGLALGVGAIFLVWWLSGAAWSDACFRAAQAFWSSWLGKLFLLGWTFSLFFHLLNGVRHLLWDVGFGFDLPTTYRTGWTVVAFSVLLTVLAFGSGLYAGGSP